MNLLKKIKINVLVTSCVYMVLGLLFLVLPGITIHTICYIIAAALLVMGASYIIDYLRSYEANFHANGLAIGILAILSSLFLFFKTDAAASVIPVLLGFSIIVSGVIKIQDAVLLKRLGSQGFVWTIACAVLCLVLGMVLVENPFAAAETLIRVIGVGLLFSGITDLAITLWVTHRLKA